MKQPQGLEAQVGGVYLMNSMNESVVGIKGQEIVDRAYELLELVESAYREGKSQL